MSDFEKAQADVNTLKNRPGKDDLLFLYAHYKQASAGDATGKRPGMLDVTARAKYDAWAKLQGLSQQEAQAKYIGKVATLLKAQ